MLFKNTNQTKKVRLDEKEGYKWIYVEKGQTIDLPPQIGRGYGFEETEPEEKPKSKEGSHGKKKISTKMFKKKIKEIKGIGEKTSEDICKVFSNEKELKDAIKDNKHLPFRNDIEEKLKKEFS
ncbi:MAG: hypothetical protein ACOC5T_04235 [Elusimicrobiota bacterium]